MARLLRTGEDAKLPEDPAARDELTAEILQEYLAEPFPSDIAAAQTSPLSLTGATRDPVGLQVRPLGEVILDRDTSVADCRRVKDYGKRLANKEKSDPNRAPEYNGALAVYYAAIAAALVFHDKKISNYSLDDLGKTFRKLTRLPWVTPELRELFAKAAEAAARRAK